MTHDVRTMCSRCGTWYWAGDGHTCPPRGLLATAPAVTPTDLPPTDRPHVVVRYSIDEHLRPQLRAVMTHPAETVVRRPRIVKECRA